MNGINSDCPPGVALLADHLDASLAAGEDLLASSLAARADLDDVDPQGAPEALDGFVRRLLQLESSLVLRLLQARRLSVEIARADATMKSVAALFRAQTDVLHDLIAGSSRTADGTLARAGDSHAYIRSRGLIAPEAAAPSPFEALSVGDAFRVGGVVQLSQILDFVSTTLDLLDVRFGLYMADLPDEQAIEAEASQPFIGSKRGPATDSLANVLGMVRAAVADKDRSAQHVEAVAAALKSDSEPVPSLADAIASIATERTQPSTDLMDRELHSEPLANQLTDDLPSVAEAPMPRPDVYRSLTSRIAEIQNSPETI